VWLNVLFILIILICFSQTAETLHLYPYNTEMTDDYYEFLQTSRERSSTVRYFKLTRIQWSWHERDNTTNNRLVMKFIIVFWDVLPCKIIVDRRFRGTCCPHHQGWWELEISNRLVSFKCSLCYDVNYHCVHMFNESSWLLMIIHTAATLIN
jgi:hypothetical protein